MQRRLSPEARDGNSAVTVSRQSGRISQPHASQVNFGAFNPRWPETYAEASLHFGHAV
jgi:hypothetical protein